MQLPGTDFVTERTGTMIRRYKLLQKVGEGGFGVMCKLKLELQRQGLSQSVWSPDAV
ncbi:MAG TPA: hypothetical protein VF480_07495 [Verrucomicrobiae bacterium]